MFTSCVYINPKNRYNAFATPFCIGLLQVSITGILGIDCQYCPVIDTNTVIE